MSENYSMRDKQNAKTHLVSVIGFETLNGKTRLVANNLMADEDGKTCLVVNELMTNKDVRTTVETFSDRQKTSDDYQKDFEIVQI